MQTTEAALAKVGMPNRQLAYGTAGFRAHNGLLSAAMMRCGIIAVLRSYLDGGAATGVCVTASHNPPVDNGAKIVEPDGGMMVEEWEAIATQFVNTPISTAGNELAAIIKRYLGLASFDANTFGHCAVVVACDTREHSPKLMQLVAEGVACLGARLISCGVATTPMLHWAVVYCNEKRDVQSKSFPELPIEELHDGYFAHFTKKVLDFVRLSGVETSVRRIITGDAACGVGGRYMPRFCEALRLLNVDLNMRNIEPNGELDLNHLCGAEHVQKTRALPVGFSQDAPLTPCFSLDGDADRVVYFLTPTPENVTKPTTVLDGDRIAAIIGVTVSRILSRLPDLPTVDEASRLSIGVIQTAYANGGSTHFLKSLTVPACASFTVDIAKTGVKNLHHKAVHHDIGIYFESNGHGTVTCKFDRIDQWAKKAQIETNENYKILRAFLDIFNGCVGDAMVDVLAVEAAIRFLGIDHLGALKLFPELAVAQSKIHVSRDKLNLIVSQPDHERWLISPLELQAQIDSAVKTLPATSMARAFVRASGTEDVLRLYAEALNDEEAANLEKTIADIISDYKW